MRVKRLFWQQDQGKTSDQTRLVSNESPMEITVYS
jgi:hypothetical protein